MRNISGLVLVFAVLLLFSSQTVAALPESYYKGKRLTIVVAFAPGAGFDITTRILARYLPKYIPGLPAVIVQNMPGGGGTTAANFIFNVARPDGLTIGNLHGQVAVQQMMKEPGVQFDVSRLSGSEPYR